MRVVSLLPASTEIICALGGFDTLAGVTHECDHPPEVQLLPRVTRSVVDPAWAPSEVDARVRELSQRGEPLYALDEQRIALLCPDVIVTQAVCDACAVSEQDVRTLASRLRPSPGVVTLDASTLDSVFIDIARVGAAIGFADEATELLAGLRMRLRAVHGTLRRAQAARPRIAVVEWPEPVFVAGHWVPEMVHRAGGVDAVATPGEHSRRFTAAQIRDARPEVLLVAPCGYDLARAETEGRLLLQRAEWGWARETAVWAIDGNALMTRPGPRLVRGIEVIARILHPSLFSPLAPETCKRINGR